MQAFKIGDKVTHRNTGRAFTVVGVAKPLEFWITGGGELSGRVVTVDAYDLIEGDDDFSFDAKYETSVRGDSLIAR